MGVVYMGTAIQRICFLFTKTFFVAVFCLFLSVIEMSGGETLVGFLTTHVHNIVHYTHAMCCCYC